MITLDEIAKLGFRIEENVSKALNIYKIDGPANLPLDELKVFNVERTYKLTDEDSCEYDYDLYHNDDYVLSSVDLGEISNYFVNGQYKELTEGD